MRTTLNIDDSVLQEIRKVQKAERKPLGTVVSDLLAFALSARKSGAKRPKPFRWTARPMGARVDLGDRDAVLDALDDTGSHR